MDRSSATSECRGGDPCDDERDNPMGHPRSVPLEQDGCSIEAVAYGVGFSAGAFRRRFREAVEMSSSRIPPHRSRLLTHAR
jgi:hypothetical protein